jgi:hypothetical protein
MSSGQFGYRYQIGTSSASDRRPELCNGLDPAALSGQTSAAETAGLERHQPPPGRAGDCWFVALRGAMARLLLGELAGPKENSPGRSSCPATQLGFVAAAVWI